MKQIRVEKVSRCAGIFG